MRLWYCPLINDLSGDLLGGGLVVYALSRALAVKASAAAATVADVLGFDAGLDEPGFNGSGGGARSGSELSHLGFPRRYFSFICSKGNLEHKKKAHCNQLHKPGACFVRLT